MKNLKFLIIFLIISCSNESIDNEISFDIFEKQSIRFQASSEEDNKSIRLDSGRLVLKTIQLPEKNNYHHANAKVSLVSEGDPWDKSGSFFIVPTSSDYSVLDLANKSFPTSDKTETFTGIQKFVTEDGFYYPPIELLRFITPFGVGYFNTKDCCEKLKPVYIAKWEDNISWNEDISHLLPILKGEVLVGIFIDTWSDKGWGIDVELEFSGPTYKKQTQNQTIISLVNTTPFTVGQNGYDQFGKAPLVTSFDLKEDEDEVFLYYLTTGHGGHETGDEFVKKTNIISLDNEVVAEFIPWRDDCASFRRFNPSSGVWTEKTEWKGEKIEERIASSDYSRSGWCPGSKVSPKKISLGKLKKGRHELSIFIPNAQVITETEFNFWNVAAYLAY
jgi:hypothetical protein